jgi:hypothetical protein
MHNPLRRNKKIGKTQGGRVKDGRAQEKWSRVISRNIWGILSEDSVKEECRVLVENPSGAYYHPCNGDEYLWVLNKLPASLAQQVKAIVLRRTPKHDARLGIEARRRYSCVILNAFPKSNEIVWHKAPDESTRRHYGRWCSHWVEEDSLFKLRWTIAEVRRYYLYHLFLHEVGHVNQPCFHKLGRREDFAENFALEWAQKMGQLPDAVRPNKGMQPPVQKARRC